MSISNNALIHMFISGYYIDFVGHIYSPNNIQLKSYKNGKRKLKYYTVPYRYNGRPCTINVHRFIGLFKFGNKIFNSELQIRHLDGNSLNNSWYNIGIGTRSQNMMDVHESIRVWRAKRATLKTIKYDHDDVKKYYLEYGYKNTLKQFNISSKGTLHYIITKKSYRKVN